MKLKNNPAIVLAITILVQFLLADGFKVPIKVSYSSSIGYDNNVFRLPDLELNQVYQNDVYVMDSDAFDAPYLIPKLSAKYSPEIFKNFKTEFKFSFSRNSYITIPNKSYSIINSDFGMKLASYRWIKISYRFLPQYYLRNFKDKDYSLNDYYSALFSSETISFSYSNRLYKKNWIRVKYSQVNLYYDSHFTEFDINKNEFEAKIYYNLFNFSLNSSYGISLAENISFGDGSNSTIYDRSYTEHVYGIYAKKKIKKSNLISTFGLSSIIKYRIFLDESEVEIIDPLHSGRKDLEYNFSIWVGNKINKKLSHEFRLKYRSKDVYSAYRVNYYNGYGNIDNISVSDFKSFTKFEIVYKIVYSTNLDILR